MKQTLNEVMDKFEHHPLFYSLGMFLSLTLMAIGIALMATAVILMVT